MGQFKQKIQENLSVPAQTETYVSNLVQSSLQSYVCTFSIFSLFSSSSASTATQHHGIPDGCQEEDDEKMMRLMPVLLLLLAVVVVRGHVADHRYNKGDHVELWVHKVRK